MSNQENEKWIEDVINSMTGSQRAIPNPNLFDKIEAQISLETAKYIPKTSIKWLSIAAALVLFLNIWTLYETINTSNNSTLVEKNNDELKSSFFKDYRIYD